MSIRFINRPAYADLSKYDSAINKVCAYLAEIPGVCAVYQFGNITVPGISDIDLLVVFDQDITCHLGGLEELPQEYRYLFTHKIAALSKIHFQKSGFYSLWNNYTLIAGEEVSPYMITRTAEQTQSLKIQTALEFLLTNYIDLKIQLTYKTFKLRSLLQHIKGILYDLEYLDIHEGEVFDMLTQLRSWTLNWFKEKPTEQQLSQWILLFDKKYEAFCNEIFVKYPMYLPDRTLYTISRSTVLYKADRFSFRHKGLIIPFGFSALGKKFFNLLNRVNTFHFYCPIHTDVSDKFLSERFEYIQEMKTYNAGHLPNFMLLTSGLTTKIK